MVGGRFIGIVKIGAHIQCISFKQVAVCIELFDGSDTFGTRQITARYTVEDYIAIIGINPGDTLGIYTVEIHVVMFIAQVNVILILIGESYRTPLWSNYPGQEPAVLYYIQITPCAGGHILKIILYSMDVCNLETVRRLNQLEIRIGIKHTFPYIIMVQGKVYFTGISQK